MNAPASQSQFDSVVRRLELLRQLEENPELQAIEMELCRRDALHWFENWAWTYDPRVAGDRTKTALMPLDLFPRQREMVQFLEARLAAAEDGLIEKSRDIGFTWVAGGLALHRWLFVPGHKTTFGSRKGEYVDRIGDPDSIFEKIRMLMRHMPRWMMPRGFVDWKHDKHMLIFNPANENTIRGEAGDDMGRGGRSTLYFIDEAAFIEHAEAVDAATSANAECRVWGSSVNGAGNLFFRKRHGGLREDQIFRFHWSDDPRKTAEWAVKKRSSMEAHNWASEYEIDYSASVEGIAIPAAWVEAAKKIRGALDAKVSELRAAGQTSWRDVPLEKLRLQPAIAGRAGGDVGAGKAKSVVVPRLGPVVLAPTSWTDPDTIDTAHRMLDVCEAVCVKRDDGHEARVKTLRYDPIGVGVGVGSALKRSSRAGVVSAGINVGTPPSDTRWPDGETSEEKFANTKAELWWTMREALKRTHELLRWLAGETEGAQFHPTDEVVSLPPDSAGPDATALSSQLSLVKWHRSERGKIQIESKDSLSRRGIASPDHADALALTFGPPSAAEKWAALGKAA